PCVHAFTGSRKMSQCMEALRAGRRTGDIHERTRQQRGGPREMRLSDDGAKQSSNGNGVAVSTALAPPDESPRDSSGLGGSLFGSIRIIADGVPRGCRLERGIAKVIRR